MPYMAVRFVEGRSLATICGEVLPLPTELPRLLVEVADTIHYVHEQGVVHRHVRPAIILVDDQGHPHLTDFGLARPMSVGMPGPEDDEIWGNLAYVSPELIEGEPNRVDGRSDVYSLGVILYQALTGRLPFPGPSVEAIRHKLEGKPVPPHDIEPRVDRMLEAICLKALRRDPERRYATAVALAEDLRRYVARSQPGERASRWHDRLWSWSRRRGAEIGTSPERADKN